MGRLLLLLTLGCVVSGGLFVLARRAARRWQQQASARARRDAEQGLAEFCSALAALGVSDRVARTVYDVFANMETPLNSDGVRPRATDDLAERYFIAYPEEAEDTLAALLSRLGSDGAVPTAAVEQIRTVVDVAKWLEGRVGVAERPA